jgi:thiol-disulfide isomerase/thioredoxin
MSPGLLPALLVVASAQAQVPPPELWLDWRGERATLTATAPAGHHVAEAAPLVLELQLGGLPWTAATVGSAAAGLPLALPTTRPLLVEGTVQLSICTDDNSLCQPVRRELRGMVEGRRGRLALETAAPAAEAAEAPALDFEEALDEARASGKPVVVDFGAVWCPPCNLLGAEIFHNADHETTLDGILLVEIDVDRPESWALKDRYEVGGYPTVVAVDGEGAVIDRLVGYPGEAPTLAWLQGLTGVAPLSAAPPPAELTPMAAGQWALRLVQGQQEEAAAPYLERAASTGPLSGDALLASVLVDPSVEAVQTLAATGTPVADWLWPAWSLRETPAVAALLRERVAAALPGASAVEAADLFYVLAGVAETKAEAVAHARAGAVALQSAMTGDLSQDRGHIGFLARLWEKADLADEARRVLDRALARWPEDMTFHEGRAALELRQDALDPALHHARAAVEHGYGDNRLRATALLVEVLQARGDAAEARALIDRTLAETPRPPAELKVRTGRYLDALEALRDGPEAPAP